jgi:serine/threonine protein kinase
VLGGLAAPPVTATTSARKKGGSNNALPVGTHLSEFEIVDLVGEGGFGIVYLAEDHSLQRRVAIKEYMPSSLASRGDDASVIVRSERHVDTFEIGRRSFVNEARLLAQFDHPALVKVYRFWEANGTAYMAMPFYAGKTLRDVLKETTQRPDEGWIRKILLPVMDALELIHKDDCFHRDVAPDNIMLLTDDRPILLDFGAARRVISDMTQALTVILKPGFAPFEQYAEMPGIRQGPWTDIYALAAVVHYMIMGQAPPPSVNRIMQDPYEPLASVAADRYSARLLQGLDQCLAVKGEDRPQSMAEMRELLGFNEDAALPATLLLTPETRLQPINDEEGQTRQLTAAASVIRSPAAATPALAPTPPPATAKVRPGTVHYVGAGIVAGLIAAAVYYFASDETPPAKAPMAAAPDASGKPAAAPAAEKQPSLPPPILPMALADAFAATVSGSTGDFGLKVDAVRTPLTIGRDPLSFVLHSKRSGYLYVLLWDHASDQLSEIFPNTLDRDNRIAAGKPVKFPRPEWAYEADPPIGNWDVIAIVSESPRGFPYLKGTDSAAAIAAPKDLVEKALSESGEGGTALAGETMCHADQACSQAWSAVRFAVEEAGATAKNPAATGKVGGGRPSPGGEKGDARNSPPLDKALDEMLKGR